MTMTTADLVWNRAALEEGGEAPRPGDRALAALLRLHGLVMNGGVHHAIESLKEAEIRAAADGYAFFGFDDVAAWLRNAAKDPILSAWTEETEDVANRRYAAAIPDDSHLDARFREVFRERADQFAPVEE